MICGADKLDISSCDTLKPISGFNPDKGMTIVRNPNYDPSTDDPRCSRTNLDGIQVEINTNWTTSSRRSRTVSSTGRAAAPRRPRWSRSTQTDPSCTRVDPLRPGRPDVVHHDEPARAAVRRPARPQGGEVRRSTRTARQGDTVASIDARPRDHGRAADGAAGDGQTYNPYGTATNSAGTSTRPRRR